MFSCFVLSFIHFSPPPTLIFIQKVKYFYVLHIAVIIIFFRGKGELEWVAILRKVICRIFPHLNSYRNNLPTAAILLCPSSSLAPVLVIEGRSSFLVIVLHYK